MGARAYKAHAFVLLSLSLSLSLSSCPSSAFAHAFGTQEASDAFADGDLSRDARDMGNRSPALEDDEGNPIEPVMYTTASG